MKRFRLSADITVSAYTTVEAETIEEAIEIAEGRDVELGGMGSGASRYKSWVIDDADGEPQNIAGD